MAMRPIWKGSLSFGLVMIPMVLYSDEAREVELDLDMLDARDHARIRYKRVNEQTGKEVPWESIVKGYQHEPGSYVILEPEDFERAAKDIVRGGIEITDFVNTDDVSPRYYVKPYVLTPGKGGDKAYLLLRETLSRTGRTGIARVVLHNREHLAALRVEEDLLLLITLRFSEELRSLDEFQHLLPARAKGKVDAREIDMAEQLVKGMQSEWDPSKYHDRYRDALRSVIERKAGGEKPARRAPVEEEAPSSYNIMDLLRRSIEGARAPRSAARKPARRAAHPRKKAG